jgi:VanZ family protein
MIKELLSKYPIPFRMAFVLYALLTLWASLRAGGGPQPIENFDKVMHFVFYSLFTVIAAGCTKQRNTFLWLSILIVCYGALMEFLQSFVPSRFMSVADIVANTSGVFMIILISFKSRLHNQNEKIKTII